MDSGFWSSLAAPHMLLAAADATTTSQGGFWSQLIVPLAVIAVGLVVLLIAAGLSKLKPVAFAVMRRNFVSYFSNPTGYVFICVFVLLSGLAAFWPHEFFNDNLANLDQLNKYLPLIMLVFIPAITMSIWADERRQGTDELLLTIPASDFDVVLGKYLAAVAIYSASLLFSLVANYLVLERLGNPDPGLFLGTFLGYWMVGLAMLGIGMVASFLTSNLTVGFVLGALFNAPLAFAASSDAVLPGAVAQAFKTWSFSEQFRDFGRGVIDLASLTYFLMIVVVALYLSMVLIGRRHWFGGRDGHLMLTHYVVRGLALIGVAVGATALFANVPAFNKAPFRLDVSTERLSSLSGATYDLIRNLNVKRPVRIEAFVSPAVPEGYVTTRLNLVSALQEFRAIGGDKILLEVLETEPSSTNAETAETQYNITGRRVVSRSRGAFKEEEIYLGVVVSSGVEKVVIPFFDRGIPIEYELVRSIATVTQAERKKVGVLRTEAPLFGGFDMQSGGSRREEQIITELKKQYEIVQVDPANPIERYDVLLAVQPSTLNQQGLDNLLDAIRSGQPTAIFEDPLPWFTQGQVPGTAQDPRPQGNPMMGQFQPPAEKSSIAQLWNLLGVDFFDDKIVWQDFNPIKNFELFKEAVFIDVGLATDRPFNPESPISSKLQQVLLLFPGAVMRRNVSDLQFTPLMKTGAETGTIQYSDIIGGSTQFGGSQPRPFHEFPYYEDSTKEEYVLAAHIRGKVREENVPMQDDGSPESADEPDDAPTDEDKPPPSSELNVVLVPDIDCIHSQLFEMRAQGENPDSEVNFNFDNVTFVLNVLDVLAGDERFVEIRKRRPAHRTLTAIEEATETIREDARTEIKALIDDFNEKRTQREQELQEALAELEKKFEGRLQQLQELITLQQAYNRKGAIDIAKFEAERDKRIRSIDRDLEQEVASVQNFNKLLAVGLPPIPPLLVGVLVFFVRRARESEGVAKSRLR